MSKIQEPRRLSQARAEETRRRILQKASEAFAEHGFAGANLREIARDAGTTHSMITYHFGSKDKLWRESVREMFELIEAEVKQPERQDLPPIERFRLITQRYARYCAQNPEHARITIAETMRGGERLKWMVDEFVRASHASASSLHAELIEAGALPDIPLEAFIYIYNGMLQLPFVLAKEAQLLDVDFTSDEVADAVLKLILK